MSADINQLDPKLQPLCLEFLRKCGDAGLKVKIGFTYRSPEVQDALYAQGRTTPGKIVTNLKGGASKHCCMLNGAPASKAFDFDLFGHDGVYITDGTNKAYTQAGEIAKNLGLIWGGDFIHPRPDYDHVQLNN